MTCFAPERDHHFSKTIARSAYDNCTKTVLDRSNFHFSEDIIHDDGILQEVRLVKPVECAVVAARVRQGTRANASNEIMCQIGHVAKGNYVHVNRGGQSCLAAAIAFLEVQQPLQDKPSYHMMCYMHTRLGSKRWSKQPRAIGTTVSAIIRKDVVYVNCPTVAQSPV